MTEFTQGIHGAAKKFMRTIKARLKRTLVYTIGRFAIAITVLMLVADVSFAVALTDDAIVLFLANTVWYFILDKFWASKYLLNNL